MPAGYDSFTIVDYSNEVKFRRSPHCLAAKIVEDDVAGWATHAVIRAISLKPITADPAVDQEVARLALLIAGRVSRGGQEAVRINPERHAPHLGDLKELLYEKWVQQRGRCALCGGRLIPLNSNPMLKLSPDRIDSEKGAYMKENLQITHLACTLAKNRFGGPQFAEFVEVVRGTDGN